MKTYQTLKTGRNTKEYINVQYTPEESCLQPHLLLMK